MSAPNAALAVSDERARPRVLAVGGGKGGVGKTVIAANLAMALAERGRRVAVVDADLGGANLHTVLGVPHPERTLADFLERRAATLQEVTTATSAPNLCLLGAARPQLGMANLKHASKLKLLRHFREIDAEVVVLDLGAGTAYDTLDFFLSADQGLLVVAPTPTSVENTYAFLRSALGRRVTAAAKHGAVAAALHHAQEAAGERQSPRELIARARTVNSDAERVLGEALGGLDWSLVVNQARRLQDRDLGPEMARTCRSYFGISVTYAGCLEDDESVLDSVQLRRPTLSAFPSSTFAKTVRSMASNLLQGGGSHG